MTCFPNFYHFCRAVYKEAERFKKVGIRIARSSGLGSELYCSKINSFHSIFPFAPYATGLCSGWPFQLPFAKLICKVVFCLPASFAFLITIRLSWNFLWGCVHLSEHTRITCSLLSADPGFSAVYQLYWPSSWDWVDLPWIDEKPENYTQEVLPGEALPDIFSLNDTLHFDILNWDSF